MRRSPTAHLLCAAALLAGACGGDDVERGLDPLDTPTFSAEDDGAVTDTGSDPGAADDADGPAAGTADADRGAEAGHGAPSGPDATTPGGATTTAPVPLERVDFSDPVGDATPGVGTSTPPQWTDLAGGSLERRGNAYRLTIRLGGDAPARATGAETMNIASFYDVDGDGAVEFEIWVNLGPDGWGPVWYDDQDNAAPGESSNVTVEIDGDEVQLLFPDVMLDAPDRLRFSIASEYGELSTIGSSFARRDDAPDGDRAVAFPT